MSANNYILVEKIGKIYKISCKDADTGMPLSQVYKKKSSLEALRKANKLDLVYGVEYGIIFTERKR